ncbi:AMP-binding protein [Streptomyces sp. NPDC089799]|uniref:AMP-binding protein n=1 Tax=Streptomyces sp. NPDC089799 TaxID=3155066 RepID=UPI0034473B40
MKQEPESKRSGPETSAPDTADSVLHRFEQWALDTPDAPAVVTGGTVLTYRELDRAATRLAARLRAERPPAGAVIAIGVPGTAEAVTGVIAVLKAGAAYALVDPEAAVTAVRQLTALSPYVLVTDSRHWARLDSGRGPRVIPIDGEPAAEASASPDSADSSTSPASAGASASPDSSGRGARPPAGASRVPGPRRYPWTVAWEANTVLFTGGPEPRPVRVRQGRLLAALDGWIRTAGFGPGDRHLFTARPDVTAFAAGWTRALCTGGTLVAPGPRPPVPYDAGLRRLIGAERVTVLHTDPGGLAGLHDAETPRPPELRTLRLVTVTGDRLHLDEHIAAQALLPDGARLLSVYGTAETAGTGTWFELSQLGGPVTDPARHSLLGRPFPGCGADVRDGEIHLGPPGGGDFVPTGDFGRYRPDGLLEFTGRAVDRFDFGHRTVDPYRIEAFLREHPAIGGALVGAVTNGNRQRLVAYVVPDTTAPGRSGAPTRMPDDTELRAHLKGRLSAQDIPATVVRLPGLPRDRAGREDRGALPLPPAPDSGPGSGKYGAAFVSNPLGGAGCITVLVAPVAFVLTLGIWPGSTDLSGVPGPWAFLFFLLYVFECLAFGAGVAHLFVGRAPMLRTGRPRRLTVAAHLSIAYLLMAWWPQDNSYRLTAKTDWPMQALLVYAFNIPLMIAAGIVAVWATTRPTRPAGPRDGGRDGRRDGRGG